MRSMGTRGSGPETKSKVRPKKNSPCPVGLPLTKHASESYSLLPIDQRARLTKYLARVHRARC